MIFLKTKKFVSPRWLLRALSLFLNLMKSKLLTSPPNNLFRQKWWSRNHSHSLLESASSFAIPTNILERMMVSSGSRPDNILVTVVETILLRWFPYFGLLIRLVSFSFLAESLGGILICVSNLCPAFSRPDWFWFKHSVEFYLLGVLNTEYLLKILFRPGSRTEIELSLVDALDLSFAELSNSFNFRWIEHLI